MLTANNPTVLLNRAILPQNSLGKMTGKKSNGPHFVLNLFIHFSIRLPGYDVPLLPVFYVRAT